MHKSMNIKHLADALNNTYCSAIGKLLSGRRVLGGVLMMTAVLGSCSRQSGDFTSAELSLIRDTDSIMRVLTIADPGYEFVLRAKSRDFSEQALLSEDFAELARLMVATVTHPSQDGVGIAGPQVGLNRRVVAVQRFDKEGEPFEVYPNISIVWASDSLAPGPEGCLSVPNRRADVLRSQEIVIEYTKLPCNEHPSGDSSNPSCSCGAACDTTLGDQSLQVVRDTVKGFTAVIFQHEVDHLEGILYTDRLSPSTETADR